MLLFRYLRVHHVCSALSASPLTGTLNFYTNYICDVFCRISPSMKGLMGGGVNMRKPFRTIAVSAIVIGVLAFSSVMNVFGFVPISAQAESSDGTMTEQEIRDAWKNLTVTVKDKDGTHKLALCTIINAKDSWSAYDIMQKNNSIKSYITNNDIDTDSLTISGVPDGWTHSNDQKDFYGMLAASILAPYNTVGGTYVLTYRKGNNAFTFGYGFYGIRKNSRWLSGHRLTAKTSDGTNVQIDTQTMTSKFKTSSSSGKVPTVTISDKVLDACSYKLTQHTVNDDSKSNGGWASKATIIDTYSSECYPDCPVIIMYSWTNEASKPTDINSNTGNKNSTRENENLSNENASNVNAENTNTINADTSSQMRSTNASGSASDLAANGISDSKEVPASSSPDELVQTGIDNPFSSIVPFAVTAVLSVAIPIIKRRK